MADKFVEVAEAVLAAVARSYDAGSRYERSAVARAAAIQQLDYAIDNYGVETVGKWFSNMAHEHGYTVTVERNGSGTIGDPRR